MTGRPMAVRPAIVPFGDSAVLIELGGEGVDGAARAQALASRIRREVDRDDGWGAAVPAAASVLVHVDPIEPGVEATILRLREVVSSTDLAAVDWPSGGRTLEIPVRYGGAEGPDLEEVAERAGLTAAAVVEAHASTPYRVLFLGFAPGFAYLGSLPAKLVGPRRASPRTRVPVGSVAIAGPHTAIYPVDSPGGWQILGRTSAILWDPRRKPPASLEPGDLVRFVPERG